MKRVTHALRFDAVDAPTQFDPCAPRECGLEDHRTRTPEGSCVTAGLNGSVWFETTPLLWQLLEQRASHA